MAEEKEVLIKCIAHGTGNEWADFEKKFIGWITEDEHNVIIHDVESINYKRWDSENIGVTPKPSYIGKNSFKSIIVNGIERLSKEEIKRAQ